MLLFPNNTEYGAMYYYKDRIGMAEIQQLLPPIVLAEKLPLTDDILSLVSNTRHRIHHILNKTDERLLVIVGPCSVHDTKAAFEYARRLANIRERLKDKLEVVMRVYFEKPRTTIGWKGMINDPYLDGSFHINDGLKMARKLLLDINELGLPTAGEFLDVISHLYIEELMSWGAIGARTTESQLHRELSSGLGCPVGFKNGTDGAIKIAIDAIKAAASPHCFLSADKYGYITIAKTTGNKHCHIILRGGKTPNYNQKHIDAAKYELKAAGLPDSLMVDFSHGNSGKQYKQQILVAEDIANQIAAGESAITGMMIESNLVEGTQKFEKNKPLTYGQSITDGCIGWEDTVCVLEKLAGAVDNRRNSSQTRQGLSANEIKKT